MERLEAALAKARESRRAVQSQAAKEDSSPSAAARTAPRSTPAEPPALWHQLKEAKLSAHAARKNRITTLSPNKNSGPYDLLRSRVLHLMVENGWQSIAVTSPNAACGKTTVSVNLAFSLARQTDLRVMLFDFDLRRPAVSRILGQRPVNSLHEVLEGKVRAEDNLIRIGENLAFGLNNRPATRPSELLQSRATRKKLEQIVHDYKPDVVIYDLPPMLASDDNVGFLPQVDAAILVGAAGSTRMNQLDTCEKEIAGLTNVMGVVLNKCRFLDKDSAYEADYY